MQPMCVPSWLTTKMSSIRKKQKQHPVQPVPWPMMHGILHCGFSVTRIVVSVLPLSNHPINIINVGNGEWCLWNNKSFLVRVCHDHTFKHLDKIWQWKLHDSDTTPHSVGFFGDSVAVFPWLLRNVDPLFRIHPQPGFLVISRYLWSLEASPLWIWRMCQGQNPWRPAFRRGITELRFFTWPVATKNPPVKVTVCHRHITIFIYVSW